ncbi:MAG TPA: hypothetical protein VJB89_03165 [Candidatus Nanoarchaeia archaeon]|nr:hypothetical protein [Candidatus Nanoarchaeia archaeon]
MAIPFVKMIVDKGLDNIDVSMLDGDYKNNLFDELGDLFMKQQRFEESAKSYFLSGRKDKIEEAIKYYLKLNNIRVAGIYGYYIDEEKSMKQLGELCLREGYFKTAKKIFEKLKDKEMLEFIKENLGKSF